MSINETQPILTVENLSVALPKGADRPFAVKDASFNLHAGGNPVRRRRIRLGQVRSGECADGRGARGAQGRGRHVSCSATTDLVSLAGESSSAPFAGATSR